MTKPKDPPITLNFDVAVSEVVLNDNTTKIVKVINSDSDKVVLTIPFDKLDTLISKLQEVKGGDESSGT